MQNTEGNQTEQVWWTSKIAKKHSLRKSAGSQAARSVGLVFFFPFSLFLLFPLHTIQIKAWLCFVRVSCSVNRCNSSDIAKWQCHLSPDFSRGASMCQLLSDELVSRFTWHKHLSANGSQELCSFNVIMNAQPASVRYKHKLALSLAALFWWHWVPHPRSEPCGTRSWRAWVALSVTISAHQKKEMYEAEKWEYAEKKKNQAKWSSQPV